MRAAPLPDSGQDPNEPGLHGRIPLVVGVTGHRDLWPDDFDAVKAKVAEIFRQLREDYLPDHPDTPIILLSALAEGTDQLVAEVALANDITLIAPLPMDETEYRKDFAGHPGSDQKFVELREQALGVFVAPHPLDKEGDRPDPSLPTERDRRYQAAGLYIARYSHVMIAIWNGDPTEATGGTSQIVRFKRDGIPFELSPNAREALDGSEIGPVIEIMAPRQKPGSPQVAIAIKPWGYEVTGRPLRGLWRLMRGGIDIVRTFFGYHPHDAPLDSKVRAWNVFRALVNQTRRFNREAARRSASQKGEDAFGNSLTELFTDYADATADIRRATTGPITPPPKGTKSVVLHRIKDDAVAVARPWCEIYRRADALALSWQAAFKDDWFKLFRAGFVAIIIFEVYAHIWHSWALMILYVLTLSYGFFRFFRARLNYHQERFLDYRALAEALRVAIFWKVARIGRHVADAYPIKQASELAWVKIVVRTLDMLEDARGEPPTPDSRSALDDVRQIWVVGQWNYFSGKSRGLNFLAEMREEWSLAALGASPIVGLLGIMILFFVHDEHLKKHLTEGMIVTMGLFVGAAAVIAGYTEQLAFKAQGRQYERMSLLFERALLLVNKALEANPNAIAPNQIRTIKELYEELGREAMKENAEWVAIYRQRPIRPAG